MRGAVCAGICLLLAASVGCQRPQSRSGELLDRFLREKETIAACADLVCYRAFLRAHGSAQTVANLGKVPDDLCQIQFDSDKDLMQNYLSRAHLDEWTIEREEVSGDRATLVMARVLPNQIDKSKPGFTLEAHWVQENGEWKIGK